MNCSMPGIPVNLLQYSCLGKSHEQRSLIGCSPWSQTVERDLVTDYTICFPGGSDVKESACSAGDPGLIPGLGRFPGEGNGNLLQYCCLANPHGQRNLEGYSPWGHKKSDTTKQLSIHQHSMHVYAESLQACQSLLNPTDSSPPGFPVHGILQATIQE